MADYKARIKNLLDLATSPNEHEAKAALLKAKELMVKYKITEMDLDIKKDQKVIEVVTKYTFTQKGEFWIYSLANVIADNYCCKMFCKKEYKAQKMTITFLGLEDDVNLCNTVFEYAVETARRIAKQALANNMYCSVFTAKQKSMFKNSISAGFAVGVGVAYEQQKQEHQDEKGWGLMVVGTEATNAFNKMFERGDLRNGKSVKHNIDPDAYNAGVEEGKQFSPNKVLA